MAPSAPATPLRQVLDERISELLREAESLFESRLTSHAAEARAEARRDTADRLNQAVRRMSHAGAVEELRATLLDAAGPFASGAAVLAIDNATVVVERVKGRVPDGLKGARIALTEAPALAGAVETRDPVVAMAAAAEISPVLAGIFPEGGDGRFSVFPVVSGDHAVALLCAWGDLEGSPLELLAQVAGAMWRRRERGSGADLFSIAPAAKGPSPNWEALPPAEQRIHLRAQRFARVQAAGMRLRLAGDVRAGRARRDVYSALRNPIEDARETFRKEFFTACPSMVDYLHLELVHTLANDDPELLGKDYPGPMF